MGPPLPHASLPLSPFLHTHAMIKLRSSAPVNAPTTACVTVVGLWADVTYSAAGGGAAPVAGGGGGGASTSMSAMAAAEEGEGRAQQERRAGGRSLLHHERVCAISFAVFVFF